MKDRSATSSRRRRGALAAAVGGALLLLGFGAAPALGAGADGPDRIIFDPGATPSWVQEYHATGSSFDVAQDVVMAAGGVTYVAGIVNRSGSSDGSLMKYVNGAPAWATAKLYDGPNGGPDEFRAVALGPGNSVYTAGTRAAANGLDDFVLVKWTAAGARQWARSYDSVTHSMDAVTAMAVDSSGNVTVAGIAFDGTSQDWLVVNWSPSGTRRWTSRLNAGAGEMKAPISVVATGDGNVYATGMATAPGEIAALTVRYSASGERTWTKTYRGPAGLNAMTWSVVARPEGGVFVCGAATSAGTQSDGLVMSYTKSGSRDVFALDTGAGGATGQVFNDLAVASTGQVVAVGYDETAGTRDCRLVTYTADGTVAGQLTFPGAWEDEFTDVAADSYAGFYATGRYHTAANKTAFATLRGSVVIGGGGFTSLWAPALVSENNEPAAVAVRGTTACVVGQYSADALQGVDQIALWYVY
jgi:hypothetical protein